MTTGDIVFFATETTGDISSEALDFARRSLRMKYATLYDSHSWREAQRVIDGTLDPTLNGALFLPVDLEEVISFSFSYDGYFYVRLAYRERDWIERFGPPQFSMPSSTPWFYRGENLAWPAFNPGQLTITTNDQNSFTFYVSGRDANNFPIYETFTLQGITTGGVTSPVTITTANSYALITSLSKGVTENPVQISDSIRTYSMPGGSTELVFTQIILYPPPVFVNPDTTPRNIYYRLLAKLKPDVLSSDMSVPRISHIWEALVSFTKSACYERVSQVAKAQALNQDAMDHVRSAIQVEKNQSEFRQQVVPTVYDRGDYLADVHGIATSTNPFAF